MNKTSSLQLKNLDYFYENKLALENVNLEIQKGFTSIIGPNGSGKTTLLKLASGILEIQSGDVCVYGRSIKELSNKQRARLFTIVQQKQFFPFPFSCLELVGFGRYPFQKGLNNLDEEDLEIMIRAMRDTDTLQFKDKLITEISGGEQQRVILASALAQQPKILFLDEAFSSMDISYQANLMYLLKGFVQRGELTVVSIVHDLNLAYRYSDEVCILKNGRIIQFGTPYSVMTKESISEVFDVKVDLIERRCFYIDI